MRGSLGPVVPTTGTQKKQQPSVEKASATGIWILQWSPDQRNGSGRSERYTHGAPTDIMHCGLKKGA